MFGNRRRRTPSNPALNGSNASPSAATAAAQAFLKNQASNASLSSAAAATALRSRPTTPTSVADVQTKRTIRRSGSASSIGSSVAGSVSGGSRPTLQRQGSTGSMTERTFRDQSPARGVPSALDAPPVPALPKNIADIPPKHHRRAASLEAPPMRVASPPPNVTTGRGSSLGPGMTAARRAGQTMMSLSGVQELTGVERSDGRGSVNFSYPTSSRPTSPIEQRRLTSPSPSSANPPRITSPSNQNMVYDANSRRFIPAAEYYTIRQRIQDAANKPVKKKKRDAPQQLTGTHLADGTVGGRPRGTAVDTTEAAGSYPKSVERPVTTPVPLPTPAPVATDKAIATIPKKKKKRVAAASDSESDQSSFMLNSSADESDTQPVRSNHRKRIPLAKKPSVVREDREREEDEDNSPMATTGLTKMDTEARSISPSPLPNSTVGRGHGRGQPLVSEALTQELQQGPNSTASPPGLTTKAPVRVQSVSPARTTHFAASPDSLVVRHLPPPRSISPRKSAMKNSNSPRGPSPADDGSGVGRIADPSEISNGSAALSDELVAQRKKANRVSFDESNIVVGQAALPAATDSPLPQSSQAKKSWFNIGRGKKKGTLAVEDDDDEVMKPRPALPSFGSVREKKNSRETIEERPLVKPTEPVDLTPPAEASPPLLAVSVGETIDGSLGISSDHQVGAILSHDATFKNAANISKSREPLPPQVLSVEGNGYGSDTDSSVSAQRSPVGLGFVHDAKPVEGDLVEPNIDPSKMDRQSQTPTPTGIKSNSEIPEITVLQPTPNPEDFDKREWLKMPGAWGAESSASGSDSANDDAVAPVEHAHTDHTTPAMSDIVDLTPVELQSPVVSDLAVENPHVIPAIMEETEESDASVYSDAAEDLTDGEGDVFQSLNAVVESPVIASTTPGLAITTPPESPTFRIAKDSAYSTQVPKKSSEPTLNEGWGKAQEYWKGLSEEKKRQLEREARDEAEADEDSDSTIEAKPAPKLKKKKKVVAQQVDAETPVRRQLSPTERTYMIQPGSKAGPGGHTTVMRSSLRAEAAKTVGDTHIRKSMRGPGSMRGSLRGEQRAETKDSMTKKNRPISLPAQPVNIAPATGKTHVRNLSAASAAAASGAAQRDMAAKPPVLRRKSSGDSDSSFKRARRSTEGSSMRRSMRGSDERQQSPVQSGRFSLRSLSPTGSNYRKSFSSPAPPASQTHLRNSLRSSVGATPSMRTPKPEKSSRLGFGRTPPAKAAPKPTYQRSSRFADSSDEEDGRLAFRSRFGDSDSDSDDAPAPRSGGFGMGTMRAKAPVRGTPEHVTVEDGHLNDLPDSDYEKKSSEFPSAQLKLGKNGVNGSAATESPTPALGSIQRSGSGRGTMAGPTTTTTVTTNQRPPTSRRGSFMSMLRRKKPDPSSKVRKLDAESAARRDTPLERTKSEIAAVKRSESYNSTSGLPSPKLQKKAPGWPLVSDAPRILGGEDGRPFTADAGDGVANASGGATNGGANGGERPDMGTRRYTATGLGAVDLDGVGKRKKKKFGALRRMFGLDE